MLARRSLTVALVAASLGLAGLADAAPAPEGANGFGGKDLGQQPALRDGVQMAGQQPEILQNTVHQAGLLGIIAYG